MTLRPADQMKSRLLQQKGYDPATHTSAQWLELALEAENTYKQIGPFDQAAEHFIQQSYDMLEAGRIAELEGR